MLLALMPAPLAAAEPSLARVSPEAERFLARIAEAYKGVEAYSDEGQIRIVFKVGDREVKRERRTPLQFLRPNKFAVDYGALAMYSDGETLRVFDFVDRNTYRRRLTRQLTVDPAALKEDDQKGNGRLVSYREKTYVASTDTDQLLGAFAGQTGGVVLTFLLEKDPIESLRREASSIDADRSAEGSLRIAYADGTELHLQPNERGLLRRVSLVPSSETLAKAVDTPAKSLSVVWASGTISTAADIVSRRIEEQAARLDAQAKKENLEPAKETDAASANQTLLPTPPRRKASYVELIRKLWHRLFG
jgi:hypothetical protein